MATVRRQLKITEISLVRTPANEGAVVALFKSEDARVGLTKADIHTAMRKRAWELFPDAPTVEQAFVRYIRETEEGREARAAHDQAPHTPAPVAKADPRPLPPSATTLDYHALCAKAEELRKERPELTAEMARVMVRRQQPGKWTG